MSGQVRGRFFVKKLRKKLLLVWVFALRNTRHAGLGPASMIFFAAMFHAKSWMPDHGWCHQPRLVKVFCGAFLQKSDRLLIP
jgi:hypothetical protein